MTSRYVVVGDPTRIPVPRGKLIEEYFGRVRTGTSALSLAHMVAPPGWGEPAQTPRFAELTMMVRGTMRIEIGEDGSEVVELRAGQAIWIEPDVTVRYSNPYDAENEYYAICLPAFSPELARRAPEEG
jgi:mannose-6-phosphate isomerase-like protein (cupin superfamily)